VRSKPDPVDQPERTAHYDCAMNIAEMLHNTRLLHRDSSVNIPLPPDQHHCSDEAKWTTDLAGSLPCFNPNGAILHCTFWSVPTGTKILSDH